MAKYKIEIKWAIIFVVMTLLWMILEKLGGFHGQHIDKHPIVTNLIMIPAVTIFVLALLDKKKHYYGGKMTYKQAFISGLIITLIVTLISPLTQYITSVWITPEYFPNAINYAIAQGKLTREAAEQYFSLNSYIVQGLIGAPIMGLLTTAIVSIFVRSK